MSRLGAKRGIKPMKPQVSQRYGLIPKAVAKFRECLGEYEALSPWQRGVIADVVVHRAFKEFEKSVSPSAPSTYLSDSSHLDALIWDAHIWLEILDQSGELQKVLDEAQTREDAEKHGL